MLEQFLGLKPYLDRRRHRFFGVRLDHWKQPPLILHRCREAQVGTPPVIATHAEIGHCASPRNKHLADFLVAKIDLDPVARAKPIVRPSLCSLAASANPAPD